ncbi:MAG: GTPase HflX [Clostridia bacterium]|nr:GTPase HflX [Clostridia bacterium]
MELHEIQQDVPERVLLVSVDTGEFDAEVSLAELAELVATAGGEVVGVATQKKESPDKATCLGSGRAQEIALQCEAEDIDLVVMDRELSPTQLRNLEEIFPCRLIDRTMLILDIFAGRARSAEGRLQVELAQLQYMLPRLTGQGAALSRQGGGIGTRGPGETKLESDKRHIRRRLSAIREQLEKVESQRKLRRERRRKDGTPTVALVGYTNAGKSTLLNYLTNAGVLAEDKLFATLDPTARALRLPDGREVMLVDTVGFVRRLPHQLVRAFHSTLEEAVEADVILNICDASSPHAAEHLQVTGDLLNELGCGETPVLRVMNKCDLAPEIGDNPNHICISALNGDGVDALLEAVAEALPPDRKMVKLLLPFSKGALAEQCRRDGQVEYEEYVPEGLAMTVILGARLLAETAEYVVEE